MPSATLPCRIVSADLTSTLTGWTRSPPSNRHHSSHSLYRRFRRFVLLRSSLASSVAPMIIFYSLTLPTASRRSVHYLSYASYTYFGCTKSIVVPSHVRHSSHRSSIMFPWPTFGPFCRSFRCACRGCRAARHRSFVIKRRGLHAPSYAPAIAAASRDLHFLRIIVVIKTASVPSFYPFLMFIFSSHPPFLPDREPSCAAEDVFSNSRTRTAQYAS